MEVIDLNQLKIDIGYTNSLKDVRLLGLLLHLHVEHYVYLLCKEKRIDLDQSTKVRARELYKRKIIKEKFLEVIELICDIRNELMHNIQPDFKLLERWINDVQPDVQFDSDYMKTNYGDSLETILKTASPWLKLQLYTVPTIVFLYNKLKEIKNEEQDFEVTIELNKIQQFIFHFNKIKKDNTDKSKMS